MRALRLKIVRFAIPLLLVGCQASVEANVHTPASAQIQQNDFDKPMARPDESAHTVELEPSDVALLGARQDLSFAGPQHENCQCVAAAVGQPSDSSFRWRGTRPITDKDSELVVALSSGGIACPSANGAGAASYWGYEAAGDDVVVVVEGVGEGRPMTSGAIIPRPLGGGQVFLRPRDGKTPYGRPLHGSGNRCQVGSLTPSPTAVPASKSMSGVRIKTDETEPQTTTNEP